MLPGSKGRFSITILRTLILHNPHKGYKVGSTLSIAIHFFEMLVLFETGELSAYVYDGDGRYRRKYVRTEGKGRTTTITLADGKLLPCIATRV